MLKKILVISFCIISIGLVTFSGSAYLIEASEKFLFTVVLDAGHGGIDAGVNGVNTNVKESELNLKTVYELKNIFEKNGFIVRLTRTNEDGLYGDTSPGFKLRDLNKRKQIITSSNADILISIHMNNYQDSRRRGAQVFYKENDKTSNYLAEKIQNRLNLMKESPRISKALKGDYYLLNTSKIPAVIVECGFLSNPNDEKLFAKFQNSEIIENNALRKILRLKYTLKIPTHAKNENNRRYGDKWEDDDGIYVGFHFGKIGEKSRRNRYFGHCLRRGKISLRFDDARSDRITKNACPYVNVRGGIRGNGSFRTRVVL